MKTLSLRNDEKLIKVLLILAAISFLSTYVIVAKEEDRKAEEKARTEINFKYLTEE